MRKFASILNAIAVVLLFPVVCTAQQGYVFAVAGGGNPPTGIGDGGPATDATLGGVYGVWADGRGNVYFVDQGNVRIRKVDASTGIITTIAGTGTAGFSGDGGPGVNAQINSPEGVYADFSGNVYFGDNGRIRKIDAATGIINTVVSNMSGSVLTDAAGNMYIGSSNQIHRIDAVTAQNTVVATMPSGSIYGMAWDTSGKNIYFADFTGNQIKKVNVISGVVSVVAGTGAWGDSGDGGPALNAEMHWPRGVTVDINDNVYFTDPTGDRIRKINAVTGIIETAAGGIGDGPGHPGHPAQATPMRPNYVYADVSGNIYFGIQGGRLQRISGAVPDVQAAADSFAVYTYDHCGTTQFLISTAHYGPSYSVKTFYGDAQSGVHQVAAGFSGGLANFTYSYAASNNYIVKHVLYNGANAIDSISYSYNYKFCRVQPITLYDDVNANCAFDAATDYKLQLPATMEVDSNNVPIDTLSTTSSFNYNAYGNNGDNYKFKILSLPAGLQAACPANGTVTATLQSAVAINPELTLGLNCIVGNSFDLAVNATLLAGTHMASCDIVASNAYCTPENAVVTMAISPKYVFLSSDPPPSSQTGNTVTWNFNGLSASIADPAHIHLTLDKATPQNLIPGDTVHNSFSISPTAGDANTNNNSIVIIDTVKGSYDPNEKDVTPAGHIYAGTKLTYAISFENTGNEPAHNIYIIDTLSDNTILSSLRVVSSSATMTTSYFGKNGHNIVRFDFPNIDLPDSSHHDSCNGMVIFSIDTKPGLAFGSTIDNKADIFFDDNALVETNKVTNVIGFPESVVSRTSERCVEIFPNPVVDDFVIKVDKGQYDLFNVVNSMGQMVMEQVVNADETKVNVKTLPAGVYYITLKGVDGNVVRKFVKM
ncbi:MAG: T9SS type A sorting domain-containing protein [Bacteroidetes bacterium]|nr:T9SS type A sorting domain-containing protein [Bacteroidota bacterium]